MQENCLYSTVAHGSRRFVLFITLLAMCSLAALAQQAATATLEGLVTDPNAAVVPNATVTVRNVNTGLERTITTDSDGLYRLPLLPPGTYEITATAPGFAQNKYGNITLTVGQKLNVDLGLRVNISETIQITDVAPIVETTRTNVSGSVTERTVRELPKTVSVVNPLVPVGSVSTRAGAPPTLEFRLPLNR